MMMLPRIEVGLNTNLHAVDVEGTTHKNIGPSSVYLPHRDRFNCNPKYLQDLTDQLPLPKGEIVLSRVKIGQI